MYLNSKQDKRFCIFDILVNNKIIQIDNFINNLNNNNLDKDILRNIFNVFKSQDEYFVRFFNDFWCSDKNYENFKQYLLYLVFFNLRKNNPNDPNDPNSKNFGIRI